MKYSRILNEITIISISLLLIIITKIYSNEPGIIVSIDNSGVVDWYSTDYMSSGGDDFDIFIGWSIIIICIINIIINMLGKNIKHFSYFFYMVLFIFQCFILFLINLDVDLINAMLLGDKYLIIWTIIFILGFIIINIYKIIDKKSKYVA